MTWVSRNRSTTTAIASANPVNATVVCAARRGDSARNAAPTPSSGNNTTAQVRLRMMVISRVQFNHLVEVGGLGASPEQCSHGPADDQLRAQRGEGEQRQRVAEARDRAVAALRESHGGDHRSAEEHAQGRQRGERVAPCGDTEKADREEDGAEGSVV